MYSKTRIELHDTGQYGLRQGGRVRYEGECEICSAPDSIERENNMVLCETCALIAETEPEGEFFWNREADNG